MWLLRLKNITEQEVFDFFDEGIEYEKVGDEMHIQYCFKKYLMQDLNFAKKRSQKPIEYEIEKVNFINIH